MSKSTKVAPELQDLADQVGEFIEYWGFKRVHGKVWLHFFLSESPLDAAEIIGRLGISKALVSMTLNELLEYEVILPAGKSTRGTELFVANTETVAVILNVLRKREKRMLSRVEAAHRLLKQLPARERKSLELSEDRQEHLTQLIQNAQAAIEGILGLTQVDLKLWRDLAKTFAGSEKSSN